MKVCLITTWPPYPDGISFYSAQLYGHICGKMEVKVLANSFGSVERDFRMEGNCKIIRCWRRGSLFYPFKIFSRVIAERPDIIHLQHGWLLYGDKIFPILFPLLLLLLRLSGKPIVVTMHTVVGGRPRLHKNIIFNFMARMAIIFLTRSIVKLSNAVIVHNNLMKEALKNMYSSRKDDWKIFVIPHGVREMAGRSGDFPGDGRVKILSLGFIRRSKGIEYLIEAFKIFSAICPESTLVIVGGKHPHDDEGYIRSLMERLSGETSNIILTGFVDEEKLDELIWNSEIIMLPSLGDYYIEASGSLARVAMYGKPIICSKVPKFKADLEDGKDCIMVEFDKPEKLANALLLLAKDADLRRRIGRSLVNKFKDRVWCRVAEQHIDLFRSLLEKKL